MNSTSVPSPSAGDVPWQELWRTGQTPWDQGAAHHELRRLLQHAVLEGGLKAGRPIFSGGCGRAHSEAALALVGYPLTAVDLVPEAIEEATKLYGQVPGLSLRAGDAKVLQPGEHGHYAAIFDRAMLCALPPADRNSYIEASKARLAPGGLWMGILFREVASEEGPPFAINERTASELFSEDFDLCFAGASEPTPAMRAGVQEWLCIWRLRET